MADNYGDVAGYAAYQLARGVTMPADAAAQLAALLVASEYIDGRYRSSFPGYKTGLRAQVREWPRTGAYDMYFYAIGTTEIPVEVINATYEVAYRQQVTPGSLTPDIVKAEAIKSVSVDGAVSVTYAGASSAFDYMLSMPIVDAILAPILTGEGSSSPLAGASYRR